MKYYKYVSGILVLCHVFFFFKLKLQNIVHNIDASITINCLLFNYNVFYLKRVYKTTPLWKCVFQYVIGPTSHLNLQCWNTLSATRGRCILKDLSVLYSSGERLWDNNIIFSGAEDCDTRGAFIKFYSVSSLCLYYRVVLLPITYLQNNLMPFVSD